MPEPRAQRTLVKSPPELWAEVSDVSTLARHLGEFGEIRITRLEAETTVVWEGDTARGTVELEPSGWGTKVTITAEAVAVAVEEESEPEEPEAEALAAEPEVEEEPEAAEPEPIAEEEAETEPVAAEPEPAPRRRGFFARLFGRRRAQPAPEPRPVAPEPVAVEPEPEPVAPEPVAVEPQPVEPEPEPVAVEPEPIAEPILDGPIAASCAPPLDDARMEAVLVGVLDDLGAAHHRPFSRG
jgi:hypothetical protein